MHEPLLPDFETSSALILIIHPWTSAAIDVQLLSIARSLLGAPTATTAEPASADRQPCGTVKICAYLYVDLKLGEKLPGTYLAHRARPKPGLLCEQALLPLCIS